VVKRGLGTRNIVRHFRDEERILAALNHPHIARLYGGGVTGNGAPYFVMEHVEGDRLDRYCDEKLLGLRERLALFRKVCSAVSYAHQRLVVHRDLKPANIRVTPEGEPKLLDFGIAKLLDPQTTAAVDQTITLQRVMTPDYASPEQIRGQPVTTATDVYSLGVVLYELLTGRKPYQLKSASAEELSRAIAEQEPTRPSTAVSESPKSKVANRKSLRGDLDNIVLMAMRKEPQRRYSSVAQFSDDIGRFLAGRTVIAHKDTFSYRTGKFVRRNKLAVAAAILVFLTLLGGILTTLHEARRAERRFNEVRHLANSLMFEIHDSVRDLQGSTPTRRLIVERALQYLDSLSSEGGAEPGLQRELATAYEKVGDIQGNPYTANLGDTDGALASYRKATAIRESLAAQRPNTDSTIDLALSYRGLGDIMEQKGDVTGCLANYRRSLSIIQELAKTTGTDRAVQIELARAYETMGDGLDRTTDNTARLANYQQALKIRRQLLAQTPDDAKLKRSTATSYMKVANVPGVKPAEAITEMKQAINMLEALAASDPQNARAHREVGFVHYEAGRLFSETGDLPAALASRRKALEIREQIAAQDPTNKQAEFDLATAHGELAESLTVAKSAAEALSQAEQAVAGMTRLVDADPTNAIYRRNVGLAYERVAAASNLAAEIEQSAEERLHHLNDARAAYQKAADVFSQLRTTGGLMPTDVGEPEKFAGKVAETTVAIQQLRNSQPR
jgi:serine/threonine protein kinase